MHEYLTRNYFRINVISPKPQSYKNHYIRDFLKKMGINPPCRLSNLTGYKFIQLTTIVNIFRPPGLTFDFVNAYVYYAYSNRFLSLGGGGG